MSHPDPLYDPDNSYEDDMNYDDYNDFYDDVDNSGEIDWYDEGDDSMDGDAESALASAGWGTDEDYGYYGDVDYSEDFHSDDGYGYYED